VEGATGVGRWLVTAAVVLAGVAVLLLLVAGPGTRAGWWHFRTGLGMMRWVLLAAVAGLALGALGGFLGGGWGRAGAAIALGLVALAVPLEFRRRVASLPYIHDITTDVADPPVFEAVLPARRGAANPPEYPGAEVAAQQRAAYPEITPILLEEPPAEAFERCLALVRDLGWELAGTDPARGTIEATDTTFWFGFRDDIVVRVRPEGTGSRVDVRSKSRVGKSDVGANAARIRRFAARLAG
jgi:uncharacterized protein (DUF1499 family)